mmetsp:Transcript_23057/g.58141  ORF Transcript_23057/g.58141 Transcript_23057/m.58141 type:complete len:492 (+) Transcript_23057:296-1771(+)
MPQSAMDVGPSSSPSAGSGIVDPLPPPEVARAARLSLSSAQLQKLCFQSFADEDCHASRVPTVYDDWLATDAEAQSHVSLLSPLSEAAAPFLADVPPGLGCETLAAACGPTRHRPANVGNPPQDVSLITQAPRQALKRKAADEIHAPGPRRSKGLENDESTVAHKGSHNMQDEHALPMANAFLPGLSGQDTTSVCKQPLAVAEDGTVLRREDSEWSISTDVSLDDIAARMPLDCLYNDDGHDGNCGAETDVNIYDQSEDEEESEDEEDVYAEFDPYRFMKYLPPLNLVVPDARDPVLPEKDAGCKKMTLVLDLDETLVHSSLDCGSDPDFSFVVDFNQQQHVVNVRQRPYLFEFLERAAELFEVVIFTASQQVYAEQLLDILDPEHRLIQHRMYRDSCVYVDGNYLKDLTVLGRDLQHTIIVDNSPHAFGFQIGNGIPIESWYEDENDTELKQLLPFLEKLATLGDVRPMITDTYKMQELVAMADEPGHLA